MRNRPAVLSLTFLLVLGIAACGNSSDTPSVNPSPTEAPVEPEVTPSPSDIPTTFEPTPVESEPAAETETSGEFSAAELREMPLDDYLALSAVEREPLITYMLEESIDWAGTFGEHWEGDVSELYKYNPLEIASIDNTAEEIAMQHLYWMQLGLMQTEDLGLSSTFDPDLATKALAGGFTQAGYINEGGEDHLTDGMNSEFDYWKGAFSSLGTFTNHDYVQEITSAEFTHKGTKRDNTDKIMHEVVDITFTTETLPETLADSYKEGSITVASMSFVWNEDLGRWQNYEGLTENRPVRK